MTDSSPERSECCDKNPAGSGSLATTECLDLSCRWTVLPLVVSSLLWLLVGSAALTLSQIKLVALSFLSGYEALSYGRLEGIASSCLVFGFGIPALLASGVWLQSRLGRTPLQGAIGLHIFGIVWNITLLAGVFGLATGDGSGLVGFELPRYAATPMACAYVVGAAVMLLNLKLRREREMYPTQWFLLLSVLWFGWSFTGAVLTQSMTVTGLLHYIVGLWFRQQYLWLTLVPGYIAITLYLVPKLAKVPLQNRSLAMSVFWTLVFLAPFGGVPASAPLPAWLVGLGAVTHVLVLIPVLGLFFIFKNSRGDGDCPMRNTSEGRLISAATVFFLSAAVLSWLGSVTALAKVVDSTSFSKGVSILLVLGAFGLGISALVHHMIPRLTGGSWASNDLLRAQGMLSAVAVLGLAVALVGAGISQGLKTSPSSGGVVDLIRISRPFFALAVLSSLAYLGAQLLLLGAVLNQVYRSVNVCCIPMIRLWLSPMEIKKGVVRS